MSLFTISNDPDPLLSIYLEAGEQVTIAQQTAVLLSEGLLLKNEIPGNFLGTLARAIRHGPLLPHQIVQSPESSGTILLSPVFPGEIRLIEIDEVPFRLPSHAFLAASSGIHFKKVERNFPNRGSGLVLEASGPGTLAIAGFGSIQEIHADAEHAVLINHEHLIAWDSRIVCERSTSARNLLFGRGGRNQEHLLRLRGNGFLYVCSRSPGSLFRKMLRCLPPGMRNAGTFRA